MVLSDSDRREMEAAIGRCISRWHQIEQTLEQMFRHLMGYSHFGPDCHLPAKIFYIPTSFDMQLAMIKAALDHRTNDEKILGQWKRTIAQVKKAKEYRDACAHCVIVEDYEHDEHAAMSSPFSRKFSKPLGQMNLRDIENGEKKILDASIVAAKFLPTILNMKVRNVSA